LRTARTGSSMPVTTRSRVAVRAASGLNLQQLSELTHYTPSALSRATNGQRVPAKPLVLAFVKACGAPNLEMWGDISHPPSVPRLAGRLACGVLVSGSGWCAGRTRQALGTVVT
jgi:hypothetical protein